MSFLKTLSLKFRELFTSPMLIIVLLVLPVLLGLTAGAANLKNQSPALRIAVTDLDKTDISRGLTEALIRQDWDILEVEEEDIPLLQNLFHRRDDLRKNEYSLPRCSRTRINQRHKRRNLRPASGREG